MKKFQLLMIGICASFLGTAQLVNLTFDDAASVSGWVGVADGLDPEASIAWDAAGNGTGALSVTGVNPEDGIGQAYIFETTISALEVGATAYTLTFDLKAGSPIVGAAVHNTSIFPGAGAVNNFDLQTAGLNESTWTSYSLDFTGVDNSSPNFVTQFQLAAGAFIGAGGTLLVDNIALEVTVGTPGCTDPNATNYNPSATIDDGSCTYPPVSLTVDLCGATPAEVRMTGPFWGWGPLDGPIASDNGDGTWTVTLGPSGPAVNMEYLWVVDGVQENLLDNVPQDLGCTPITDGATFANRLWLIGSGDVTGDVYDLCTNCDGTGGSEPLTLTADLCDATPAEVRITGPFWGWDPGAGPVAADNGDGTWTITLDPAPVADMEYLWVADGVQENLLDNVPQDLTCTPITDGAAYANRLWTVGSPNVTGDVYDSCTACPSTDGDVTFSVNMNDYITAGGSFTFVNVSGDWNGFCPDCNQLTDGDGDNIWEGTFPIPAGSHIYKYQVDGWVDQEDLVGAGSCTQTNGGYTNRTLDVEATVSQTLGTVCWGSCYDCPSTGEVLGCNNPNANNYDVAATQNDGSCLFNVTFQLNTTTSSVDFTGGAHILGQFNGWCGGCAPLTETSPNIWELTVEIQEGSYEYLYSNDEFNTIVENVSGLVGDCAVSNFGFNNRYVQITDAGVLPIVCWESCVDCIPGEGCTDPAANNYDASASIDNGSCLYDVIFTVDMNNYGTPGVDFTTPEVNGNFNGWCGGCAPMTETGAGTNVWTVTIELGIGIYEYQFAVDSWTDQEFGLDPAAPCTIGANRFVDVTGQTDIGLVCWESCSECVDPVFVDVTFRVDMSNETISPNGVHIAGAFQGWDPAGSPMTYLGFGIYEITFAGLSGNQSYQYKFINGNAFDGSEEVIPVECNVDNNRQVAVGDVNLLVDVVCFGECAACAGCTDPFYAEYNPFAGSDDGSCVTLNVSGCTYPDATNYNASATVDDGSCEFAPSDPCPADLDGNGSYGTGDLLALLALFGGTCTP